MMTFNGNGSSQVYERCHRCHELDTSLNETIPRPEVTQHTPWGMSSHRPSLEKRAITLMSSSNLRWMSSAFPPAMALLTQVSTWDVRTIMTNALNRAFDGGELHENVDAVLVLLDHLSNATHLPFDLSKPRHHLAFRIIIHHRRVSCS